MTKEQADMIEKEYKEYSLLKNYSGYVEIGWSTIVDYERAAYIAGRTVGIDENEKLKKENADLKRQLKDMQDDNKRHPWDDLGKWSRENTF